MITWHRFTEQNLHDCREELQSKTEELKSVLESSTIAENELREEATLRKRYVAKTLCCQNSMVTLKRAKWLTVVEERAKGSLFSRSAIYHGGR